MKYKDKGRCPSASTMSTGFLTCHQIDRPDLEAFVFIKERQF